MVTNFYDLSVQLLGNVPVEFAFVHHFFVFGLCLVVVFTIIAPFYLTYRLLKAVF